MSRIPREIIQTNDLLSVARQIQSYCSPTFGLEEYQSEICRKNPSHIQILIKASKLALTECQRIFKNDRWQCNPQTRGNQSLFSYILNYRNEHCNSSLANKETAFLNALSTAALHYTLAEDCKEGRLPRDCGCSIGPPSEYMHGEWAWKGCGDNVEYGEEFSRLFTQGGKKSEYDLVRRRNCGIGIKVVKETTTVHCDCLGKGGKCEAKTCWQKLPAFQVVGNRIQELYDSAVQVVEVGGGLRTHFPTDVMREDTLVYVEGSPNYCERFEDYGIEGVVGRECNPKNESRLDLPYCHKLCCGRGFERQEITKAENCNCRFVWCCRVECDTCTTTKVAYYCL
ncbi:protein Wnt-1-like [Octopus sinensis]|uniref:Protein Wnt n=1 Tax=Octopus sinensis TaxID=2607531 RepID=A0A6P7TRW6_9MOLL|nr:protein Wnt-1-like [Octopus sinensis]